MISMTGFACKDWADEYIFISIDIKGYNSRFLEINVYTPPWLSRLEPKIRGIISAICGRGKIEVSIRLREINAPLTVTVNENAVNAYMRAVSTLAKNICVSEKLSMSELIGMEGVLEIEKSRDEERYWSLIEPVLTEATGAFLADRAREGKHTEEDILNSIGIIEMALQIIKNHIPGIEDSLKENIKTRFIELSGSTIDENRVLAETAILLVKYTISEEVSRLSSHLTEFRAAAKTERPGKKLDFLCQEINRDINTIGSKSTVLEVSRAVVEMKEALENVREQLRNVE
jgi:uncharacterized protein (TIGR00255 family)